MECMAEARVAFEEGSVYGWGWGGGEVKMYGIERG